MPADQCARELEREGALADMVRPGQDIGVPWPPGHGTLELGYRTIQSPDAPPGRVGGRVESGLLTHVAAPESRGPPLDRTPTCLLDRLLDLFARAK